MKNKIKHYIKEIIYFIVAMTLFANTISLYRSQDLTHKPLTIQKFKLTNNQNYKIPTNKPILLHFWATWCPTCKLEASNINYLNEHNYTFRVVNDKNGKLSSKFHIAGFPTTFIYDKEHKLRFSEVGYTSILGLYLRMLWAGK